MEKSSAGRVLLPAHIEQSNLFRVLEAALQLSDYKYVSVPDDRILGVIIGDEVIRVSLNIEEATNVDFTC